MIDYKHDLCVYQSNVAGVFCTVSSLDVAIWTYSRYEHISDSVYFGGDTSYLNSSLGRTSNWDDQGVLLLLNLSSKPQPQM